LIGRKIGNLITTTEPKVVNGPELLNKYVGQGEENIRNLFADAKNDDNLHVIIFDEIDAICKKRGKSGSLSNVTDSMVNQFLSMIDGVHAIENIFIIGLTNRKDLLDDALLRPGRLEVHVEIGLPDVTGREQIFRIHTSKMSDNNMMNPNVDLKKLANDTENFSGAEIESVVKNASSFALNELLSDNNRELKEEEVMVQMYHFNKATKEINPAFGNSINVLKELLPEKFLLPTQSHKTIYNKLNMLTNKNKRLQSFLLFGLNGSGKTTMIIQAAKESKVTYTKLIRPIDLIGMDEYQKIQFITDVFKNAYISKESLIILDDIEILIDYAKIGHSVTFSNKIYQTLLTVLKTTPLNRDHKLTIISTCGEKDLVNIFKPSVDYYNELGYLEKDNIEKMINELNKESNIIDIPEIDNGISIKRLLLNLD
jgi:vesicle-fusing ATPase